MVGGLTTSAGVTYLCDDDDDDDDVMMMMID